MEITTKLEVVRLLILQKVFELQSTYSVATTTSTSSKQYFSHVKRESSQHQSFLANHAMNNIYT